MKAYDPATCSLSPDDAQFLLLQVQAMFGSTEHLGWDSDVCLDGISLWRDEQTGLYHLGKVWYSMGGRDSPPDGGVDDLEDYTPTRDVADAVFRFLREVFEARMDRAQEAHGELERSNYETVEQVMES